MRDRFLEFIAFDIANIFPDYINFNIVNLSIEENKFVVSATDTKQKNYELYFDYDSGVDKFQHIDTKILDIKTVDRFVDDNIDSIDEISDLFDKFILSELGSYKLTILEKLKLRNIILSQKLKAK